MSPQAREKWAVGLDDYDIRMRFVTKIIEVPRSECLWWTGAISGRGHGRFWLLGNHVVIAHRFAYALVNGLEALDEAPLLGHRCDNPLCQRIDEGHVVVSSARANRREYLARRDYADPLRDPRGARLRADALRGLARTDPVGVRDEIERVRASLPEQLALW